jgi:hypothetical protein
VLTQQADDGSDFTGWSGAGCTGAGECSVTLDRSKEVVATFGLEPATDVTLTTEVTEGSGTIKAATGSVLKGRDCTQGCRYPEGTDVTLAATFGEDENVVDWSGCDSVEGTICEVKLSADREVGAAFSLFQEP